MSNSIGQSVPRIDARDKVTGKALYSGDLVMPGMLFMKTLFAGHPHARILKIDTSQALALPGVVAIFTAADVPVNEFGLQWMDQPVLCGPSNISSTPVSNPGLEGSRGVVDPSVVRCEGDRVAVIVAESEAIAAAARKLVRVDYEDIPAVFDAAEARQPAAPRVHPEIGDSNICVWDKIRKGDVDTAFKEAAVIVEGEYHTPYQEHAYLQPEAGLAYVDENGVITVKCAGQWTHTDQEQIAHALGISAGQVRVIYPAIGGAFGGREDMSIQIVLALAAWKLNRPVKIIWSRQESIIGHGKRHPMTLTTRWAASREGKLLAAETTVIADAGAYMYTSNKVLGNCTITATGPYFIPNVREDVLGVYTNNVPTAAFRGFGAPQALWMAELQMDKLAEKLGLDPVEFRHRNALRQGDTLNVGTPAPGRVSIVECIEAAARRAGWENSSGSWKKPQPLQESALMAAQDTGTMGIGAPGTLKRGRGFACGFKNVGFSFGYQENSWARVEIHGDGEIEHVVVWHAGAEVGQGTHTVMAQFAAETISVPFALVSMITSDTLNMGNPGSASASRMTFMSGSAIKGAAELALAKWKAEDRPAVAEYTYLAPQTTPFNKETGYSVPNLSYAYAAQTVELEVDTETGFIKILRVVSADDVGNAINPALVQGQIEGAVVQAEGYALTENMISRAGHILTDQLSTYLIPSILDIPDSVESVILEIAEPTGPYGARGLGELPLLPLAPAIAAAVHDATGVWINEFPLTPERVLRALGRI
jgi:CO/xanthine dehydrogenase Mo-binding subunit